ncbi:hypothetical protein [Ruegeria meonggei]|uniref:Uncharacterized protein n=1 Tax=Ruegeria meonggei TaxID=1446476 RepID=A0A1X7ACW4_9RHOB|nr:hypothetical protein [Ruegeria meonggei]SLN76247.1 hypothetical protein RUM8411_04362 [Ruegeria meonggei]
MQILSKLAVGAMALWLSNQAIAGAQDTAGVLELAKNDGRATAVGIDGVNEVLRGVGVRVSTVAVPEEALPLLEASHSRAIAEEEAEALISHFELTRDDLLAQIEAAGRVPTVENGGFLITSEPGVAPWGEEGAIIGFA